MNKNVWRVIIEVASAILSVLGAYLANNPVT